MPPKRKLAVASNQTNKSSGNKKNSPKKQKSASSDRKSSSGDTVTLSDLELETGTFPSPKRLSSLDMTTTFSTETIPVTDLELKDFSEKGFKTPEGAKQKKYESTSKKPIDASAEDSPSKRVKLDTFCLTSYFPEGTWKTLLQGEFEKDYWKELETQLNSEYESGVEIFPPRHLIFHAFKLTPLEKVKLVILGQDPYHDNGQACGLSFSVPRTVKVPSSLRNVFKELSTDIPGFTIPNHGDLSDWAERGIFLLNATLTVQAHKPNSHAKYGWQKFTDQVIWTLSHNTSGVVFILWGNFAHKKEKLVDGTSDHSIIKTAHPSGMSWSKFCGCKCFSNANQELRKHGKEPINWNLE